MAGSDEEWGLGTSPGMPEKGEGKKKKVRNPQIFRHLIRWLEVDYRKLRAWGFVCWFPRAGGWRGAGREPAGSRNQLVLGRT